MDDPSTSHSTEQIIFRCVNCITDIRGIRFTCRHNDCEDTHLCGECFCMHAEPGKHKKTHPYEIWNEASFKLFTCADEEDQWLCIDEQRLLQAVERYGHGNWTDAAVMVPGKTAKQVEDHYNDFYVDGNIGNISWKVGGYSSERALVKDVGIPECSPKQNARNIQLLSNLEVAEMNYMPSRDEFYKEYDNEAEEEISQLVFQDGEDELDRKMKLALIDGCQRRLQERSRRKNVASEFGLLHLFLKHEDAYPGCEGVRLHKGETRFRSEICANLKLFLQYMTFDELISFLQNLTSQIELKARIRDLCRARKHGVTRLDAMPHFEIARQHREKYMQGKDQDGVEGAELAPEELQVLEKDVEEYRSSRETARVITSGLNSKNSTGILLVPAEATPSRTTTRRKSHELLSEQERQLCADLKIEPKLYMDYKLRIILLVERKRQEISDLPGLTTEQTEKLVNYLAAAGLLRLSSKSKRKRECSDECGEQKSKLQNSNCMRGVTPNHRNVDPGAHSHGSPAKNEMEPARTSPVGAYDDSADFGSSSRTMTAKTNQPSTYSAAPAHSVSSKSSVNRARLLTSLQGNLETLKPWLAKRSPNELIQLKSRLSPQSFAIIQLLARADPKPASSSSSSPSDESSSSSPRASSEDETNSPSLAANLSDRSLLRDAGDLRNYHLSSGLFSRTVPLQTMSSSGSSRASSAVAAPPPNDHDYYSVRPHNGSIR